MRRKRPNVKTGNDTINLKYINEKLEDCSDLMSKMVYIESKYEAYFYYLYGLTDKNLIQRDFINPLVHMDLDRLSNPTNIFNLSCEGIKLIYNSKEIVDRIIEGNAVFICNDIPYAVSCNLSKIDKRNIEEPVTEKNVRGPHEGFVEPLETNLSILRRKIKNNRLKFKTVTLGTQTRQEIVISYIEGIANIAIVNKLYNKISKIKIDGLPAIGYVEQSLISHPNSLFPQFLSTERPDKAMAALLEGRIVVLQEGTPIVLIAPVNFFSFFHALDDYSTLWIHGTFLRMLRFLALIVSILLPALYIAITSFHYYAVPLTLLVPLAESRAKVPFPPIIEVLILEAMVEMLREAAVRLPTYIGTAIGVVAGLIIGEAAVRAGIVSGLLIVIVATTAVASYIIPSYDMSLAVRILRFIFIVASSVFGIIGIVMCTALTIANLMTIESLGQPYFQPIAPFVASDIKDTFFRLPIKYMKKRQLMTRSKNTIRGRRNDRKK